MIQFINTLILYMLSETCFDSSTPDNVIDI